MSNKLKQTPSQTVGPFFSYALTPEQSGYKLKSIASPDMRADDTPGVHIKVTGKIYDGNGDIISDAMIEIWQADASGNYLNRDTPPSNETFTGFGRCDCEINKEFYFNTIKPGSIGEGHAPHLNMIVFMRGMLTHAYTRVYFSDEDNSADQVINSVPNERRKSLIAERTEEDGKVTYQLNLHMQGDNETVFFDV